MEAHVAAISTEPPGRRREIGLGTSSDERLARLVAGGSEAAFAALYDRYHQCLFRYCRSLVYNDVDAQDALQSTFAAAYAALTRCEKDIVLRPWLFRIAHNESISLLRRRRPCEELPEITDDASGTLQERLEQRQQLEFLITDLRELPDQQRGALLMRELSGLPYEEIATALSTSTGSIKRAIFDARHALCELREGRDMACDDVCRVVSNSDRRLLRGRRIRGHLRECPSCAAFAKSIPVRRKQLHALTAPLSPVAASTILSQVVGGGSAAAGAGGGAASAGAGIAAGGAMSKITAIALVATATVGVTTELRQPSSDAGAMRRSAPPPALTSRPEKATHFSRSGTAAPMHATPLGGAAAAQRPRDSAPAPSHVKSEATAAPSTPSVPAVPAAGAPRTGRASPVVSSRTSASPPASPVAAQPVLRPSSPTSATGSSPSDATAVPVAGGATTVRQPGAVSHPALKPQDTNGPAPSSTAAGGTSSPGSAQRGVPPGTPIPAPGGAELPQQAG